jgi:menaquinone-specific isochorismate synthase
VQSVVTALAPHVKELRTSEEPFALELPNVWHLATDLDAAPGDGGSSLELVEALHPTAAVAGTPTRSAVEAIARIEPFDRERYAGATGWIDAAGDGEWVIALRGAQLGSVLEGRRRVTAYAGGGIVAGSDPQHELRETVSKFRPIAEALAP